MKVREMDKYSMVYVYLQDFSNVKFMASGIVIPNLFTNYRSHIKIEIFSMK